jgi:hypothetical protein
VTRRRAQIDVRTKTMSDTALMCRSFGHSPVIVPTAPAVRADFRKLGQRLVRIKCGNGCSYWREIIIDMATGETIGAKSGYDNPQEYLVQETGSGRLPRGSARVAFFEHAG